jgi:TatD DNase family protein
MLIDTHAHVNFNAYSEDSEEVIRRALKDDVWMINVGSQWSTSQRAVEFAKKFSHGVFAAIGLHPIHLKEQKIKEEIDPLEEFEFETRPEIFDYEKYNKLASHEKVVAIGEVGLDYYHLPKENREAERQKQKDNFIKHLELAKELNKPVIIHCREAHSDVIEILKEFYGGKIPPSPPFKPASPVIVSQLTKKGGDISVTLQKEGVPPFEKGRLGGIFRGVVHSFSGRWSQAEEYFELGFLISFNGLITFARDYDKVIKNAPLERILLETDCPYLTPEPHRGKRNEPSYVKLVAEKIAEIKGISSEEVAETTTKNARELFKI